MLFSVVYTNTLPGYRSDHTLFIQEAGNAEGAEWWINYIRHETGVKEYHAMEILEVTSNISVLRVIPGFKKLTHDTQAVDGSDGRYAVSCMAVADEPVTVICAVNQAQSGHDAIDQVRNTLPYKAASFEAWPIERDWHTVKVCEW